MIVGLVAAYVLVIVAFFAGPLTMAWVAHRADRQRAERRAS